MFEYDNMEPGDLVEPETLISSGASCDAGRRRPAVDAAPGACRSSSRCC